MRDAILSPDLSLETDNLERDDTDRLPLSYRVAY
jgi:hypothetical protein